jgi:hypothetical protein
VTKRLSVSPVTTEGQLLHQISSQLDELLDLVRPAAPSVEPADDAPVTGEPEPKPAAKKTAAKKATARKRVTGQ